MSDPDISDLDISAPAGAEITTSALVALVRAWRGNETKLVKCPACGAPTLDIADRSARPHREWYALSCSSCGFSKTITVSLASPIPGAD